MMEAVCPTPGTHRHPVEFAEERVRETQRALDRLRGLVDAQARVVPADPEPAAEAALLEQITPCEARFEAAMDDDFSTPQALAVLFDLSRVLNAEYDLVLRGERTGRAFGQGVESLFRIANVLGLRRRGLSVSPRPGQGDVEWTARIEALVRERDEARKRRNWERADALRDQIELAGAAVEDIPKAPSRWKPKPAPTGP
jgi:cysteinyl-tRNA synthetase